MPVGEETVRIGAVTSKHASSSERKAIAVLVSRPTKQAAVVTDAGCA
jgi:hypothetical protein